MSKFDPYEHLNISPNGDGSITRLLNIPTTPATGDVDLPGQAAVSKDVVLNAANETYMRIFRPTKIPSNDNKVAKLPIIIFFHGGGWIYFSSADVMMNDSCSKISAEVPAILISVNYRLAPEHRLPAQYEDAMDTIHWVSQQAKDPDNGDAWFRDYADFGRCYLYGSSCGANIAFNAGLRVLDENVEPLKVVGLILNQPFFGGKKRTKSELRLATDQYFPLPVIDLHWELALPPGTDRDHRFCNPLIDGTIKEKMKHLGRCLVIGFGGDTLIDRQQDFVQMLVLHGVLVEARFDDVGFHNIDLIDPRRALAILNFIKEFV